MFLHKILSNNMHEYFSIKIFQEYACLVASKLGLAQNQITKQTSFWTNFTKNPFPAIWESADGR